MKNKTVEDMPAASPGGLLTPAQKIIAAFGGVRATARAVGRNQSSVSRWQTPVARKGTGGRIPSSMQQRVLDECKARGFAITAEDIISNAACEQR